MNKDKIIQVVKSAFDETIMDEQAWDELDTKDDGEYIQVHMTVMDLKRIREIVKA